MYYVSSSGEKKDGGGSNPGSAQEFLDQVLSGQVALLGDRQTFHPGCCLLALIGHGAPPIEFSRELELSPEGPVRLMIEPKTFLYDGVQQLSYFIKGCDYHYNWFFNSEHLQLKLSEEVTVEVNVGYGPYDCPQEAIEAEPPPPGDLYQVAQLLAKRYRVPLALSGVHLEES